MKPFFSFPAMSSEEMNVPVPNLCLRTYVASFQGSHISCQLLVRSAYKKKEIFRHVSLPGSEEGHEEHLDENDGGVEGKRLKELLVNIQTHRF